MKHSKRVSAVIAAVAVVAGLFGGLAYAATQVAAGTAKLVTAPDVLAGTSGPVTVRVTNPSGMLGLPGGATVNLVVIHPANGFTIQAPPSPVPAGWHYTLAGGDAVFSGGTIAAGGTADFTVPTQVTRPAANKSDAWQAKSSADDGETMVLDSTDSTGTMTSTIHVLKVTSAALTAPAAATDNSVTSGQSNTVVSVAVQNAGSAALTVTPTLASGGGGDTVGSSSPAQSVAGNDGTATFTFPVTFGSVSGATPRHFAAGATATGAPAAIGANTADITVQSAAAFTYVANSLSPRTVPSGNRAFSLSLSKTGDTTVTPSVTGSALNFTKGASTFAIPVSGPASIAAGSSSPVVTFSGIVPGTAQGFTDGTYTGSVHMVGTDGNGAVVNATVSVDSLTLDNNGPVPVPTLTSSTLDKNGKQVIKDGSTLTFGGNVYQNGTSGPLDTTAAITSCALDILGGAAASHPNVTSSCTVTNGVIGGSVALNSGNLPSGTVALTVNTHDAAGNTGTGTSPTIAIDNVAPTFSGAITKTTSTIVVTTSEPVKGTFQAQEWNVSGVPASAVSFDGSDTTFGSVVTLTSQSAFGPNDTPAVSYSRLPAGTGVHDGAGNVTAPSAAMQAKDGILPPVPNLSLVDGKQKFQDDGRWYTNNPRPTFTVSGLQPGDTVTIRQEASGTPGFESSTGDPVVCSAAAGTGQTSASCSGPSWASDGVQTLYLYTWDQNGNRSADAAGGPFYGTSAVVFDRVAPALANAAVSKTARTVTVNASEKLGSGRNFAVDWVVSGTRADGSTVTFSITSVTAPSLTSRVLNIDANDANFGGATITGVAYGFRGSSPSDRYVDRAGNYLADGTVSSIG